MILTQQILIIMVTENQKDILSQVSDIKKSFSQNIVRPLNNFGFGGFIFDVEGETSVNLQADITDHFTEDNTPIQDHIATRPEKITLKQYVGELVYREEGEEDNILQNVTRKLTIVDNYLPQLTQAASQLKGIYENRESFNIDNLLSGKLIDDNSNKFVNIWALVKNLNPEASAQQRAFMFFEALFEQKILVSIQTPFKFYTNMAIESIQARQQEGSRFISDFSITLKKIRVAETRETEFVADKYRSTNAQDKTNYQKVPTDEVFNTQGKLIDEEPFQIFQNNGLEYNSLNDPIIELSPDIEL